MSGSVEKATMVVNYLYWPPNYFSIIKFNSGRKLLFTLLCILQKLLIIKVHFFSGTERKTMSKKKKTDQLKDILWKVNFENS